MLPTRAGYGALSEEKGEAAPHRLGMELPNHTRIQDEEGIPAFPRIVPVQLVKT
jgi:hypothetical protein